jgi:hypothetical protein
VISEVGIIWNQAVEWQSGDHVPVGPGSRFQTRVEEMVLSLEAFHSTASVVVDARRRLAWAVFVPQQREGWSGMTLGLLDPRRSGSSRVLAPLCGSRRWNAGDDAVQTPEMQASYFATILSFVLYKLAVCGGNSITISRLAVVGFVVDFS